MDHYRELCHRVGELLSTAGLMDAHLRTSNSEAPLDVLERWEGKLQSLTDHLGTEMEEMMGFAEFYDRD